MGEGSVEEVGCGDTLDGKEEAGEGAGEDMYPTLTIRPGLHPSVTTGYKVEVEIEVAEYVLSSASPAAPVRPEEFVVVVGSRGR